MQKFIRGALLLMMANFITRIIAFFYRVYIVRLIGSEGIGLYEMVFPVYSLILVITTAGIPMAVSKLISEAYAKKNTNLAKKIFFISSIFLIASGVVSTVVIIWFVPYLATKTFSDTRVYWPFLATTPAIFIVAVGSVYRGYFQGIQDMLPSSLSLVFEQIVRFIVGIYLATLLLRFGVEFSAAGLALAMVCGEMAGLITLLIFFKGNKEFTAPSWGESYSFVKIIHAIYTLAVPVTLTRVMLSTSLTLQAILIPKRLVLAGNTIREATQLFGQFSGMAFSLINLPTVITVSLAVSLVPAISEAVAWNNFTLIRKRINQSFRITILTAVPVAVIFMNLAKEIMQILYHSTEASNILKFLATGCPFFYLQQTTGGILQGLGRVDVIFRNALVGTCINIGSMYLLTPFIGINGAIIAGISGAFFVSTSNLKSLFKLSKAKIDWYKDIIAPVIAGVFMSFIIKIISRHTLLTITWNSLLSILIPALIIYIVSLLILGATSIKEISMLYKIKPNK